MQQEALKILLRQGKIKEVIQQLHHHFSENNLGAYSLKTIQSELNKAKTSS